MPSVPKTHRGWKWIVTILYGIPLLFSLPLFLGALFNIPRMFTDAATWADPTTTLFYFFWFFVAPLILATSIVLVWWKSLKWALLILPLIMLFFASVIRISNNIELNKIRAQEVRDELTS